MINPNIDRAITVSVYTWEALAEEKIYITTSTRDAQELISIVIPGMPAKKRVYIEPRREYADKIVYLSNPNILDKVLCLSCGNIKNNPSWQYCDDFRCGKEKNEVLVAYLKRLLNGSVL
jgi:hypothetical protein